MVVIKTFGMYAINPAFRRDCTDVLQTMKVICKDCRQNSKTSAPEARGVSSVSADVDRLLGPKSYEELEVLEKQIRKKLDSNEPMDVDYWEHLLRRLMVWKAKAKMRRVSQTVISSRLQNLRNQQHEEAVAVCQKLQKILRDIERPLDGQSTSSERITTTAIPYDAALDPEPSLKLRPEDKNLESLDEKEFLEKIVSRIGKLDAVLGTDYHVG